MLYHRIFLAIFLVFLTIRPSQSNGNDSIWVADGLKITKVADDELVPDCTTVTVDPKGRIVASGRGYIRLLRKPNSSGQFSESQTLASGLKHGAHGLCFHDGSLYYTADNGIWKIDDTNDDGVVDSSPSQVLAIKTGGEHDAHALRVGPDGYWYVICGNGTKGMFDLQNVSSPRITNPRAGAIWRISPDWSSREVWAHGFRNAYDFDFAPHNQIVTFDSDGERDVSLPWYRPTRVYQVQAGDDAGWVTRSWKRPDSDAQMPEVLAELGRGSPTGVLRYRNTRLPDRFQDGTFVLDWTFGRIAFVGDDGGTEIVAKPKDTAGFAVTDIAQTTDGKLVVSVGGRRSRGGIYMIDATEPNGSKSHFVNWYTPVYEPRVHPVVSQIAKLRARPSPSVDRAIAAFAIRSLSVTKDEKQRLNLMSLLIESLGGLGKGDPRDARGKQQVAAVFDGYRGVIRPKIDDKLREDGSVTLLLILGEDGSSDILRHETVRTLAVLEPNIGWREIVDDLKRCKSPIEKTHRLIALARLPVARSDRMTADVIDAMLEIPVLVHDQGLSVDRHWSERLGELFAALRRRDSLMPTRLVTHPDFGHVSHLVWTHRMNPEGLEIARRRYLTNSDEEIDPTIARFIALGDDAVPRKYIRRWLGRPETREAAWIGLASHPQESDALELTTAALSLDKQVREAAVRALKQLGHSAPEPKASSKESIKKWMAKSSEIVALESDTANGKDLFQSKQCAKCHNGSKALGPSLVGISKRFGPSDLLRATVDPNFAIPNRYQAQRVLTSDGKVITGMKIYQSVDGITLLTADFQTQRINADSIETIRPSSKSLMPEGLLDGMSDQQVADLISYLHGL